MDSTIYLQAAIDALKMDTTIIPYAKARQYVDITIEEISERLKKIPSAQPEIIRCKDCKWKQGAECVRFAEIRPFPNDFCSRAERRE